MATILPSPPPASPPTTPALPPKPRHPDAIKVISILAVSILCSVGCFLAAPFIAKGAAITAVVLGVGLACMAGIYAMTRGRDFILSTLPPPKKKKPAT